MPKKFSIITIFPEIAKAYLGSSILGRALERGIIQANVYNLRHYTVDRHSMVDDYPYGGGPGMVMKPDPFFRVIEQHWPRKEERRVILLSPRGRIFTQSVAQEFASDDRELVFLCGRYEAIDERVHQHLADEEISTGDYVITGGELPALVIIDAVSRLVPGVLGDSQSAEDESFSRGLLDYPHYTRPEKFRDMAVPKILLSGNHREIGLWRKKQSLQVTLLRRPDMLDSVTLSDEEKKLLKEIKEEAS